MLLKDKTLTSDNVFPGSWKEAMEMLKMLGVDYTYHVCPNDCILYRGKYANKDMCPKCGHNKYQE